MWVTRRRVLPRSTVAGPPSIRVATASLVPTLLAHVVWDVLVLLWLPLDAK